MNDKVLKKRLEVLNGLIEAPQFNNAGVVGKTLVEAIKLGASLPQAEKIFREMESRIRLIGLPMKIYSPSLCTSQLPERAETFEYGLWVAMNGPEELQETLKKFKLKPEDVDIGLEKTGFLIAGEDGPS